MILGICFKNILILYILAVLLEHAAHKDHFSRGSNGEVGLNSEVTSMGQTETPPVYQLG